MDDGLDYKVRTKIRFWLDFTGGGEFNSLLLPDVQRAFVNHVKELYERDDILGDYVSDDLHFRFDGRWVDLEYAFSCHDENEAEAEGFSEYSVRQIQEELEEFGCKLTRIACSAEKADMTWYDQLEDAIFRPRDSSQQSSSTASLSSQQLEKDRVENFIHGHMQNTASSLVKKLQPCPTLACIAGNIPQEKGIHWNISEECYRIRSEEIKLCLHGLIEHSANLAVQGNMEQLPVLRDFVCSLAAFWPENLDEDDPIETERQYSRLFDETVAHAMTSGEAPDLSKEQKETILIGLENYLIDFVSQYSEIGQEALESGLGACESVAAGLQQTWGMAQEQSSRILDAEDASQHQSEFGGMTMQ